MKNTREVYRIAFRCEDRIYKGYCNNDVICCVMHEIAAIMILRGEY